MNVIELVTKYLPLLDEQYKRESRSAVLDVAPQFIQETRDAKKIKIAKMNVDGLADYSRNGGFTKGSMDLTWEEHEFTQDRGRALQVDALDNMETFGLAFGRLAGEFQRMKVVPEIDAYRFSTYFQKAGTKVALTVTAGGIINFIDAADAQLDDDEVPEEGRILFVNPQVYKLMINDPSIQKHITVTDSEDKTINKKFYWYDNHMIIKVPSGRFLTKIKLLSGKDGEEAGGYTAAEGAEVIGMMMIHPGAVLQTAKRRISRIWAPTREESAGTDGVNPDADAWKFDFRVYHDAWIYDEKLAGVYAATIKGDGITRVTIEEGSYDSATGTWTKGGVSYKARTEGSTVLITGTIPYAEADATLGLPAGNRVALKITNSGIGSKAALPDGVICKMLKSDGTYNEYTKSAFEDDGSLIHVFNVNNLRVGIGEITWFTGETTTYVFNSTGAVLAAE